MAARTVAVGSRRLPRGPEPDSLGLMRESSTSENTAALREKLQRDGALPALSMTPLR